MKRYFFLILKKHPSKEEEPKPKRVPGTRNLWSIKSQNKLKLTGPVK